mmetsp:Transcript_128667/g.274635  ORF Transcript_128667/g.274635 Transcript_128667/m.274635 type:complete len:425 (+) Transcript_128667:39-1313(+)
MTAALMDELHALVLEHLEQIGVSAVVVSSLRQELNCGLLGAKQSNLSRILQYAKTGTLAVTACTLSGKAVSIDVSSSTTVRELKNMIQVKENIPFLRQQLVHERRTLEDGSSLAACGISPLKSSISLIQVVRRKLYAIGGNRGSQPGLGDAGLPNVEAFDPISGLWAPCPPMETCRAGLSAASMDGMLYAIGGKDVRESLRSAECFDPILAAWTPLPPMVMRRFRGSAVVMDGRLYAVGGQQDVRCLSSAEVFDPDMGAWRVLPPMAERRASPGVAEMDGRLYVIGGRDDQRRPMQPVLASCEVYDPSTQTWSSLPAMSQCRSGPAVVAVEGSLFVVGGYDGTHSLASVEAFNPRTGVWASMPSMTRTRARHAAAVMLGKIFVIGGHDGSDYLSCGEVFDMCAGEWASLPSMSSSRDDLAAAVM